jgi:DNA-binding CsgD family transcriptional regulator
MSFFKRFFSGKKKEGADSVRRYSLDQTLIDIVSDMAARQGRSEEEIVDELMKSGLNQQGLEDRLWECWESLTAKEKQTTALTCLGYTNRQIAYLLNVSPETIKARLRTVSYKFSLHKFQVRTKSDLRLLLESWDFSRWDIGAQR